MVRRRHAIVTTDSTGSEPGRYSHAALARLVRGSKVLAIRSGAVGIERSATQYLHTVFKFTGSETMSIFGKIMSAIFGTKADAAPAAPATPGTTTGAGGSAPGGYA